MKFGVLETHTIHIPGDERSRTNPGHGYPAHDEHYQRLHEFANEAELSAFLKQHDAIISRFRVIRFEDMTTTRNVSFTFLPKE